MTRTPNPLGREPTIEQADKIAFLAAVLLSSDPSLTGDLRRAKESGVGFTIARHVRLAGMIQAEADHYVSTRT